MRYLILFCLFISFNVFAETSLWRISKDDKTLYIGGTIHLLSASDYPLPIEFEQAYLKSDKLVLEVDLAAMNSPEVQQQLIQRVMYKPGQSLVDNIRPETYQALKHYTATVGMDINALNQFKPSMVILALTMAEFQRLGMTESGVDAYFNQKAIADVKPLGALESLEVQLDVIENLGKGHEDEMIISTIAEMQEMSIIMDEMKQAWRTGNHQVLEKLGLTEMKRDYPELYQLILVKRNKAWLPIIEAMLETEEVEFVLVGVLHLVSDEGVIVQLRQKGYKVEVF